MLHASSHYEVPVFDLPLESSLIMSRLIYYFADVRDIVRDHDANLEANKALSEEEKAERTFVEFQDVDLVWTQDVKGEKIFPSTFMHKPISFKGIIEFLTKNRGYIKQDGMTDYPTFVPDGSNDKPQAMLSILDDMGDFDAEIVDFDDQFSEKGMSTELIFSVIVDRSSKNIVVMFRGTVNTRDMVVDGNFWPSSNGLVKKVTDNGAMVHTGFCHYLCKKTDIAGNDSQFRNITRILKEVYSYKGNGHDYSDYSLVLSGHSLGGALAQLSTFLIAGHPDSGYIPSPVTGITYASPVVGNRDFFDAFRKLEKEGRVRHIRVSNAKDIIPGNPFFDYVQTGVNIHLKQGVPAEIAYENTRHCLGLMSMDPLGRHSIFEEGGYYERLYDKDEKGCYINAHLLGMTVEDLYKEYANLDEEDGPESCTCGI
jgi:hypothetical protein